MDDFVYRERENMYCRFCEKKTFGDNTVCDDCAKKRIKHNYMAHPRFYLVLLVVLVVAIVAIAIILLINLAKNRPEEKIKEELDSLLVANEYSSQDDLGALIANSLISDASYEIKSFNGDNVVVIVTAPNIYTLYKETIQEQGDTVPASMEEYEALVENVLTSVNQKLENQNYEYVVSEITITRADDAKIEISYELINALYGGLLSLQEELVNEYIGGDGQ